MAELGLGDAFLQLQSPRDANFTWNTRTNLYYGDGGMGGGVGGWGVWWVHSTAVPAAPLAAHTIPAPALQAPGAVSCVANNLSTCAADTRQYTARYDRVLLRGLEATQLRLVADQPRTPGGGDYLSDHFGLLATLRLSEQPPGSPPLALRASAGPEEDGSDGGGDDLGLFGLH